MDPSNARNKSDQRCAASGVFLGRAQHDGETREHYERSLREELENFFSLQKTSIFTTNGTQPSDNVAEVQPNCSTNSVLRGGKEEPKKIRYKKKSGAADGAGESYEWKMLALVFLRLLASGHEFQLASNVEAAGLFDDIVVKHREHSNDPWRVAYLQLKHKLKKSISKVELLGLSKDFSLVKYCVSYASLKSLVENDQQSFDDHQIIIFTNASIADNLVDVVAGDELLNTGGKAVSFKTGGEVYRELCELVDFKAVLTELQRQVYGKSIEEVRSTIENTLKSLLYQNKSLVSWRNELFSSPTTETLEGLFNKLKPVTDKGTYKMFLTKLQVYTSQAHESELDAMIKKELANVWISSDSPEAAIMLHEFQCNVKSWWQKDNYYLVQDSRLWFDIIKSQTQALSKSTVDRLTKCDVEFVDTSLQVLHDKIIEITNTGGILNLRVDFRTAASSLKVLQALAKFGPPGLNVLHVNVKALLEREDDVLSAWATRWCQILLVECDDDLELKNAVRISSMILEVIGRKTENKSLVLIAQEKHKLNVQLFCAKSYVRFNDNFVWSDLTAKTRSNMFSRNVVFNGCVSQATLSDLVGKDDGFVNKADLEVLSQLLTGDLCCGQHLAEESKFFITRRLKDSVYGAPLVVNSVSDVIEKVVLIVAEPGMGKSTLITHLAKSATAEQCASWIVHIKLNDCVQHLRKIDVETFDDAAAKKFLEDCSLDPENRLEKLLFGSLEHNLVVFIDGVDEVCPHYEEQVFALLSSLKDMKFKQLWVASRPIFQAKLEQRLKTKAFHLVAFSEEDQVIFFNKFWETNVPSATTKECIKATESLLSMLSNTFNKDNPILEVPLMSAMIAEIYQEQLFCRNGASNELEKIKQLDIMNLYNKFVAKKFDLYCVEKKKSPSRELASNLNDDEMLLKQIHHNHRLAAVQALFNHEDIDSLHFEGKDKFDETLVTYLKEVSDGRDKLGIIDSVIDGIPHFVHLSFAEYFAASWLAHNFRENYIFLRYTIFNPSYKYLGKMLNRSLAENHPLHTAILNRDLERTLSILRGQPSFVDVPDDGGRTPLHLAVLVSASDPHPDCIRIVRFLIEERKANLYIPDEVVLFAPMRYAEELRAWAALHALLENEGSVKNHNLNFMEKLIGWSRPDWRCMLNAARNATSRVLRYLAEERGGKLDCRGERGETMIHGAAEGGNIETLEHLLYKGLPINKLDDEGNTALWYASHRAVPFLLSHGLRAETVNKRGSTVLLDTAQEGAYERMAALLDGIPSFDMTKMPKVEPDASLLCAAFTGDMRSVQLLVVRRVSVHHRDNKGHSPAWVAMYRNHIDVMNWLLLCTSSIEDTTLNAACTRGELEIVSFLLSQGADIEGKGCMSQTPLIVASTSGHLDVVKLLLENGASLSGCDERGRTALHGACFCGHEQVAALLLRLGADIEAADSFGRTPLHVAISNNVLDAEMGRVDFSKREEWEPVLLKRTHLVGLLLRHGANVNTADRSGRRPLHLAACFEKLGVVKVLLEKGARVDCLDLEGQTPRDVALIYGCQEDVELMDLYATEINRRNDSPT